MLQEVEDELCGLVLRGQSKIGVDQCRDGIGVRERVTDSASVSYVSNVSNVGMELE